MKIISYYGITILIGAVVTVVLAEVALSISSFSSELLYLPHPEYGWSNIPNMRSVKRNVDDSRVEVRINSKGLRDREYDYEKPDSVFRVLVLGDSFAEAVQVPLDQTFTKQLEQRLTNPSTASPKTGSQVINTGVSGYGTDNELLFYTNEGYKYEPDLVLLAFYVGNDLRNNSHELEFAIAGGDRKPYYTLGPQGLELKAYPFEQHQSFATQAKVFLNTHLKSYAFLRQTRDRFRSAAQSRQAVEMNSIPLDLRLLIDVQSEVAQQALRISKALIVELNQEVARHGAKLFVVLIPTEFQVLEGAWKEKIEAFPSLRDNDWGLGAVNDSLGRHLTDQGIAFVDLLPGFRSHALATGDVLYLHADGHWNAAGHELAAKMIAAAIDSNVE